MARVKKAKKIQNQKNQVQRLKDETKHSILAILSIAFGIFFTLSSFGKAGIAGRYAYELFKGLLGAGFFLLPLSFFLAAIPLLKSIKPNFVSTTIAGTLLFLFSTLGITEIFAGRKSGGYIGYFISLPFLKFFGKWASLVLLSAALLISLLIILDTSISLKPLGLLARLKKKKPKDEDEEEEEEEEGIIEKIEEAPQKIVAAAKKVVEEAKKPKVEKNKEEKQKSAEQEEEEEWEIEEKKIKRRTDFTPPPLDLLEGDKGRPSSGDIKANANIIKRTLKNFGIDVEMGEINIGPSVTQYTLKPAEGIKLSRIVALQNDLALALAAHPLRIEAPIPGKSLVGVEIPNSSKTLVGLHSLLQEKQFQTSHLPLLLALGKDVSGKPVFANLAKMPHLLIAGATGAGKSINIHSIIISLLYRNSPESLRFIMVDPKRVELTTYNKIPHMLTPVITSPKKAVLALKWACKEMERRYEVLLKEGVRDIESYHKKSKGFNSLPYLIIIIDELADLMATYPREIESSIVRLAQMSRAVGIHLIVSTQRPSVEVITGLIKANITARIALQVASQIDSRTILDMSGAEKLLGKGDMLYLAGDTAKPKRIQGPFISEKEIKRVVDYLAEEYKNSFAEEEGLSEEEIKEAMEGRPKEQAAIEFDLSESEAEEEDDDLYEEARELVIKSGKASSSYLQRKLKVGYARAARLIDMLEERGVVGPAQGSKPREVLIKEKEHSPQAEEESYEEYNL